MAYATSPELVARFPHLESQNPAVLDDELDAASEWIDDLCQRTFTIDTVATVRQFATDERYVLDLGRDEIGSSSGVTIDLDDGTGTFGTTLSSSDYVLEPVNAATRNRPFTAVRALTFVWPVAYTPNERQTLIRITAKYGWPSVPLAVKSACMVLANDAIENPGAVRSEAIDGYSVTYSSQASKSVEKRLATLRRLWAA